MVEPFWRPIEAPIFTRSAGGSSWRSRWSSEGALHHLVPVEGVEVDSNRPVGGVDVAANVGCDKAGSVHVSEGCDGSEVAQRVAVNLGERLKAFRTEGYEVRFLD